MNLMFDLREYKKETPNTPSVVTYDISGVMLGAINIDGVKETALLSLELTKKEIKAIEKFSMLEHIRHELYKIPAVSTGVYITTDEKIKGGYLNIEMRYKKAYTSTSVLDVVKLVVVILNAIEPIFFQGKHINTNISPELQECYNNLSNSIKAKIDHIVTYKKNRKMGLPISSVDWTNTKNDYSTETPIPQEHVTENKGSPLPPIGGELNTFEKCIAFIEDEIGFKFNEQISTQQIKQAEEFVYRCEVVVEKIVKLQETLKKLGR